MPSKWEVTKAVRSSSELPMPARCVMFVLADIAEAGTAEVPERFTPSLDVLAREAGMGRSTAARMLNVLEKLGWLTRELMPSGRNRYRLLIPWAPDGDPVTVEDRPAAAPSPTETDGQVDESRSGTSKSPIGINDQVDQSRSDIVDSPAAGLPYKEARSVPDQNLSTASPAAPPGDEKPAKGRRGTRIPDGFHATADMIAWAREHTPLVGAKETAAFIDWFTAAPGQKGLKLDWQATWRNWMRRAQADAEARAARAQPRASPQAARPAAAYHQTFVPED